MIRGVSRYSVEINRTGSPYFERAICFVKPRYAGVQGIDLHKAAVSFVERLDGEVEAAQAEKTVQPDPPGDMRGRLSRAMPTVIAGLSGAAVAFLICLLL